MSMDLLTAENLLDRISRGEAGWQGLDQKTITEAHKVVGMENLTKQFEKAELYAVVFGSVPGQAVLKDLLDSTVFISTMPIDQGLDNAASHGLFRQGQNSMVMEILKHLSIAKMGPPSARVEE